MFLSSSEHLCLSCCMYVSIYFFLSYPIRTKATEVWCLCLLLTAVLPRTHGDCCRLETPCLMNEWQNQWGLQTSDLVLEPRFSAFSFLVLPFTLHNFPTTQASTLSTSRLGVGLGRDAFSNEGEIPNSLSHKVRKRTISCTNSHGDWGPGFTGNLLYFLYH